ncbi:MAG: hypothetical protein NUV57_03625 [archaeon]|nr:hypothetical protein [archaeon]
MIENNLEKLGFSPSEIKVYLYLIERESSYANRISAETELNRTNVYEALDRLVTKGIVSTISHNKVKSYKTEPPESLKQIVLAKEAELKETMQSLTKDISKLRKPVHAKKDSLEAGIFTGRKGLRILFEEILETNKPICFFASQLQFKSFFGAYFEQWHKKRAQKGIKQRTIFPKDLRNKVKKRTLLSYKFVDNKYISPTTTILFSDTTLFIQWSKEPLAIKIQNKEITKSHLNYFNLIWNSK